MGTLPPPAVACIKERQNSGHTLRKRDIDVNMFLVRNAHEARYFYRGRERDRRGWPRRCSREQFVFAMLVLAACFLPRALTWKCTADISEMNLTTTIADKPEQAGCKNDTPRLGYL